MKMIAFVLCGTYKQAPGSFLFTLTNMHEIELTKFPLKDENDHKSYDQMFRSTSNNDGIYVNNNSNINASSLQVLVNITTRQEKGRTFSRVTQVITIFRFRKLKCSELTFKESNKEIGRAHV